jgi:hypothetical protein
MHTAINVVVGTVHTLFEVTVNKRFDEMHSLLRSHSESSAQSAVLTPWSLHQQHSTPKQQVRFVAYQPADAEPSPVCEMYNSISINITIPRVNSKIPLGESMKISTDLL